MVTLENIKLALESVRSNLLRSILTMTIIAFGIMALVGILTAIDSILMSMTSNFSGLGANSFAIGRKGSEMRGRQGGRQEKVGDPISFSDAMTLIEKYKLPAKISVSGSGISNIAVIYSDKKTNPNVSVLGINEVYLDVNSYGISNGRSFSAGEFTYGVNVCIVGSEVVKLLFGGNSALAVDKVISVQGNKFKIAGVLETQGASMTSNTDRQILIPLLTQKKLYGFADQHYNVIIAVPPMTDIEESIAYTTGLFRVIRGLRIVEPDDFEIEKSDAIMNLLEENTATIRIATIGIGLITLVGAAIGLMNIMLVSVTERTREIGIRKALGATKQNILTQFLVEAIVICQLGGLVGIVFGIVAGNFISFFTSSPFLIPWSWISLGVVTCLIVGLISGIYPAMKAAELDPVESLRHE